MAAGAFQIVDDVVAAPKGLRVWRMPVVLLGLLLVLAGILALAPITFVVVGTLFFLRLDGEVDLVDDTSTWLWILGLTVGGYLALRVGVRLLRARRRSVLFLRRFGFTDATKVLSEAITRGLGRRWRLITLDDLRVIPVGLARRSRLARAGPWLLVLVIVVLLLWVLPEWYEAELDEAMDEAAASADEQGLGVVESIFSAAIAAAVVVIILTVVALLPVVIAGVVALFGFGASVAVRRAEGRRAVRVDRERQVDRVVRRAERATARIYAPRLTVVRCANEVWQAVVRRFAELTDATVIDVSEASPGLLWELGELDATHANTWILIGRRDRLESLRTDGSPAAAQLRSTLDGQTVLAYRQGDTKSFERALNARLTHVR